MKVMGLGQKNLAQVGSGQPSMVWVGVWKISLKNLNFSIFSLSEQKKVYQVRSKSTSIKDRSTSYLLQVKSMLRSVRVKAHLYLGMTLFDLLTGCLWLEEELIILKLKCYTLIQIPTLLSCLQ